MQSQHIVKNRILRQLSADELKSVQPWLTPVQLQANAMLLEQGAAIDHIYFPVSGMVSLLVVMQTGEAIETGIVGAEGLFGGDAPINGHLSPQATVQLVGAALTMPKAQFVDAYHAHARLRNLVNRYQAILLMQARQNAACHALHSVRGRLCRWLLQSQDIVHLAAVGTIDSQRCLPGCAKAQHVGLDAGGRVLMGFGTAEKKRGHDGAPFSQAGAQTGLSATDAWAAGSLSMIASVPRQSGRVSQGTQFKLTPPRHRENSTSQIHRSP